MWGRRKRNTLQAGETAPGFILKSLSGGQTSFSEMLAKGPALLVFFKIGCPVCQLTFPFLERMAANQVIPISAISQDEAGPTAKFNERFGITFETLLDSSKEGYPVSNAYGISSVPSFFLVEQDGRISKAFQGFCKRDLEELGSRMGVAPFRPDEKVPEFKPG